MSKIASLFVNLKFFDFESAQDSKDMFYNLFKEFNRLTKDRDEFNSVRRILFEDNNNTDFFYNGKFKDKTFEKKCEDFYKDIKEYFGNDNFNNFCIGNVYYVKVPVKVKAKSSKHFRLLCVLFECDNIELQSKKDNTVNSLLNDANLRQTLSYYLFPIEYGNIH